MRDVAAKSVYDRERYLLNRESHIAQTSLNAKNNRSRYSRYKRDNVRRNRIFTRAYLAIHPCVDCGESDTIVLEFDHVRGEKIDSICKMSADSRSIDSIKKEIEKCEVRCANCHRRRHKEPFWYIGD